MKLRIYIDTSVFSANFDARAPDRRILTEEFWSQINQYECGTSDLAVAEINQTPDVNLRQRMQAMLTGLVIYPLNPEMITLARAYIAAGAFTPVMMNDALHVAAATLTRNDILISWNFKHLVNRRRRAIVNSTNAACGLPSLDILSPPEV